MRNTRLRYFLAAASVTTALAAFIAACGDDDSDTTIAPPDAGGSETSTVDRSTPDSNTGDTGKADTGTDAPVFNPGDAAVIDGGPEYEGGINCVVGGQAEQEINDTPDAANPLRYDPDAGCTGTGCSKCGVIFDSDPLAFADAGDASGAELEYVTFELLPSTGSYFLQFGGDVTLTLTVEGNAMEYVINASSSPALPFTLGKKYFVQVKSNTGQQTPWRVTLYETPK